MKKNIRVFFLLGWVAAVACSGCAITHVWTSGYQPDEYHTAKTTDDWTLALYRYRPAGPAAYKTPVILCHGLGMNGSLWDLKQDKSFARYLSGQGFDVWVVDLRGAGRSSKPTWVILHDLISGPDLHPARYENTSFRFEHADWNIDDYVTKDVPAILQEVKKQSGATSVHWVGHSMGGMIMFAYLIRCPDPSVKDFVAMATPMSMPRPHLDLFNILEEHSDMKQLVYLINNRIVARSFGVLSSLSGTPLDAMLYNRENMQNEIVTRLLENAVEDLSPGVVEGFLQLIKTGEFVSADKSIHYTQSLSSVRVPLLLVGGWSDTMCSIVSLYDIHRAVASQDKTLRVFGRANGYRADYGHNDLIVGRYAPQDVYPYLARWLKERS